MKPEISDGRCNPAPSDWGLGLGADIENPSFTEPWVNLTALLDGDLEYTLDDPYGLSWSPGLNVGGNVSEEMGRGLNASAGVLQRYLDFIFWHTDCALPFGGSTIL